MDLNDYEFVKKLEALTMKFDKFLEALDMISNGFHGSGSLPSFDIHNTLNHMF